MGRKFALIIGNSQYDDAGLSRLPTAKVDVSEFADVLLETEIGQFDDVVRLADEGLTIVRRSIAYFFKQAKREDLLVLYFSGHGVKDEQGQLYLAVKDTERSLLAGTSIEAAFITAQMDRSESKRQVLILDCCHSGAFARGTKSASAELVGTGPAFEGRGYGRVVLTATDATQYAWEGTDQIIGHSDNSVFTHHLLHGLKTGEADRDGDGLITVDELYDYVYDHVVRDTPKQTPCRWSYRQQGEIVMAKNRHPLIKPVDLPLEVRELVESALPRLRAEAIPELVNLLGSKHRGLVLAARNALKSLTSDDSKRVSSAAEEALAKIAAAALVDTEAQQKKEQEERERLERENARAIEEARQAREREESERKRQEHERSAHEVVARARAMFAEGRQEAALEILRAFEPAHDLVLATLKKLEQELRASEEAARRAREEAERKRQEHERNAREVVARARAMFAEGQQEAALEALRAFEPPHDLVSVTREKLEQDLERLRKEQEEAGRQARERVRREELERQIRELEQQVAALVEKADNTASHDAAIEMLRQALQLNPDHQVAKQSLARRTAARDEEAVERARQQEIVAARGRITDLLERGELDLVDRAIAQAEAACQEVEAFEDLRQGLTEARQAEAKRVEEARQAEIRRRAEAERQARIEQASARLIEARTAVDAGRFEDALEILRAVALLDPESKGLAALHEEAESGKAAADRAERIRLEVARLLSESSRYLERSEFDVALARVDAALNADPGNPEAVALRKEIETAIAEAHRRQVLEQEARELRRRVGALIEQSRATAHHEKAIETLRAALELDPENAVAGRLLVERIAAIEREARERERQQHIAAARRTIADLLAANKLDDAGRELTEAERECREEAGFKDLRNRLAEAAHTRLAVAAVEAAREQFATGARNDAIAALAQFSPPHPVVTRALEDLQDEIKRIRRDEERLQAEAKQRARRQRRQELQHELAERFHVQADALKKLVASTTLWLGLSAVLVLILGTWAAISYFQQEVAQPDQSATIDQPAPETLAAGGTAPGDATPGIDAGTPPETLSPAPSPPPPDPRLAQLERLARQQFAAGNRRSLDTLVSGLKLDPNYSGFQSLLTEISKGAEADAARARAEAGRLGSPAVSSAPYRVAETRRTEGTQLQNQSARGGAGAWARGEASVRAFWAARDAYVQATQVGNQLVRGPDPSPVENPASPPPARPGPITPSQGELPLAKPPVVAGPGAVQGGGATTPPVEQPQQPANPVQPPPARNEEADRAAIRQMLDRYEAAYASLDVQRVSELLPYLTQSELQGLATTFRQNRAINMQVGVVSITFSNNGTVAQVSVRTQVAYDPVAGRTQTRSTDTSMILRKVNNVWVFARQ